MQINTPLNFESELNIHFKFDMVNSRTCYFFYNFIENEVLEAIEY